MDDEHNSIVNTQMLEFTGLSTILNPHSPTLYGIHIFKLAAKIEVFILFVSLLMLIFSIYYSTNNVYGFVSYVMLFVGLFGLCLNHFYLIKCSDAIWNCMSVMNINFLSFENPRKQTLKLGKLKYKIASYITLFSCIFICTSWMFSPLLQQNTFLTMKFKNTIHNYRLTPMQFILPISDEFYNKHYTLFYIFDMIVVFCCNHVAVLFDLTVITICTCIESQLQYIAKSYSTFLFVDGSDKSKQ